MTDPKRKADSDIARQPFCFPEFRVHSRQFWIVTIPLLVLFIVIFAIQLKSGIPTKLPPLQVQRKSTLPTSIPAAKRHLPQPKVPEPQIRVNVTPGGTDSFILDVRGPYRLLDPTSNAELTVEPPLSRIVVRATKNGLKFGTTETAWTQLEIAPEKSPAVRVDGHLYRGRMRLFRRTDGKVSAVNVLPIEEYLASVVDSEMPAKFPDAARRAQAIVARTYALYQAQQADPKSVFDLMSSQRSQKYLGVEYTDKTNRRLAGESASSRRAVQETRGMVCILNNQIFCTYYSAVCGGQTINGKEVFKDATEALKSTRCEWCSASPYYRWTTELPRDDFAAITLKQENRGKRIGIQSVQQTVKPGEGRICQFELHTRKQNLTYSGIQLRDQLPAGTLLSPHFQITLEKDKVTFQGRGHGHGVGFCQWGAKGMAEAGHDYPAIISHYFAGAKLKTLNY